MTIQQAIEKAIEGGWRPQNLYIPPKEKPFAVILTDGETIKYQIHKDGEPLTPIDNDYYSLHKALLDPLFWQSLGKAMGWDTSENNPTWLCPVCAKSLDEMIMHLNDKDFGIETWRYYWHAFIDHLAEGKDIESFFASL